MKMKRQSCTLPLIAALAMLFVTAAPAFAASSIVYVAFNGSDSNACTRSAQCKTITHALTVVAADGVVDITSSGIYDTFTVTQSVSVEADPGVDAIINVPASGIGITVNGTSTSSVALKNLSVWGSGNGVGIQGNTAASLLVGNCVSRNVSYGIALESTSTSYSVAGGDFEGSDTSIYIRAGNNLVSIDGVRIPLTGSNAAIDLVGSDVTVTHSVLSGDGSGPGIWVKGGSTAVIENDVISGYGEGVQAGGGLSGDVSIYLSNNTISNNTTGVSVAANTVFTRSNNTIERNATNVSGSLTPFSGQ
jgi:hypothetical protein